MLPSCLSASPTHPQGKKQWVRLINWLPAGPFIREMNCFASVLGNTQIRFWVRLLPLALGNFSGLFHADSETDTQICWI